MGPGEFMTIAFIVVTFAILGGLSLLLVTRAFVRPPEGHVIVINSTKGTSVAFDRALVMPVVHRAEIMDIRPAVVTIRRSGKDGVLCQDGIRADVELEFSVKVGGTTEDVLKVAGSVGCLRATNAGTLHDLFAAKFSEAVTTVLAAQPFEAAIANQNTVRDTILQESGSDLNGYHLEDLAVVELAQTPIDQLDPTNLIDAKGIEKLRAQAAAAILRTAEDRVNKPSEIELKKRLTPRD